MNNILKLTFLFCTLVYFQVRGQEIETVKYQNLESRSEKKNPRKIRVYMDIPNGFEKREFNGFHFGENGVAFKYLDGSELYISNAFYDGTTINIKNRYYSNKPRIADADTVDGFGVQENKLFWRELIVGKVVVGYLNVPLDKKEQYDKSLLTLRRKK